MSDTRNVVIIGSGPAGLTAAIYTGRANLAPLMLEGEPSSTGDQPGADLRRVFIRQLQIFGSTLGDPSELRELLNWCAGGRIRPVIDSHFTMDRIHDALDRLEAGAQFGKLEIEVAEA